MASLLRRARPVLLTGAALLAGLPGLSLAQDYFEPARITGISAARPIGADAAISEPSAAAPLRWKAKGHSARAAISDAELDPFAESPAPPRTMAAYSAGWNKSRIDGSVQPAQFAAPDPITDPFGDRAAQRGTRTMLTLQPAAPDAIAPPSRFVPLDPPPAGDAGQPPLPNPNLNPNLPSADPGANFTDPQSLPGPSGPSPLPDGGFPAPSVMPRPDYSANPNAPSGPCERIYNDRDCCEVGRNIQAFRDRLRNDSIRNISLDITPRFVPDQTSDEDRALRQDRLRLAGARQWHNRDGEVVATGHLADLRNGRAVITDDGGAEVARIPMNSLADDDLCFLAAWWRLPSEGLASDEQFAARNWLASNYSWHASALCHKPLYFEEVQAERYGHVMGPFAQPVISGAHFFLNIAALPYKMAINPPMECQYALGYYRPGSCAPWMIPPVPLSVRGALAEAGVIVGGIHVIP
jgi:hypothetical protein